MTALPAEVSGVARRQTDSERRFEQSAVVRHKHSAIGLNRRGKVQRVKRAQRHVDREHLARKVLGQLIDHERFGGFDAVMHRREHAHDFIVRQHAFATQTMQS